MNLSEIRKDIILFKDETLKVVREMSKQLFEGVRQKSNELDSKITELESKLSKYKESNKRMFDIILEQKVYLEKIKNFSDYKSKTETRLLEFDIKLSKFFSELVNFKSHYDKIINENLNIPGIIGVSCKYNTIADYIADTINKNKLFHSEQDRIKNEIFLIKKNNENLEKSLNGVIDVSVSTSKMYADARNNEIKNFINKKIEHLNNLVSETKNTLEENVYKKDDVKNLIKNELKISKKEILNIIEGNSKKKSKIDFDKDNKDILDKNKNDKSINAVEIKKELKEIKKNFNDLKINMETKIMNTLKLMKNQDTPRSNKNVDSYLKSKKSTMNPRKKSYFNDNDSEKQDNLTIRNSINNTETVFKTLQNNETKYFNNTNNNIINKDKIEEDKEENNKQHKKQNDNIEETINSISYKIENNPNQFKIKNPEKTLNQKSSKLNHKLKGALLNPIYLETNNNQENDTNKAETPIINIYNSPNKENLKHQNHSRNVSKYKTFSENKYNFAKKFLQENNINNLIKSESKKKRTKIYLNTKEFDKEKKYVINSIKSANIKNQKDSISNKLNLENENDNNDEQIIFRKNLDNSDNDKNNIAIKLIKNKKQVIDEFNLNYIKQYYPTLNLYKTYYNKKLLENKEKEKNKEKNKFPKKISPAFGRTAYTELVKPDSKINLKKYNGNVNIIIDNNLDDIIQERKYFYTMKGVKIKHRSFTKDKNNIDNNINNISV